MEDIYSGIIIYLIGYSGVGKRTIAGELIKKTDMKLINHIMIYDLLYKVTHKNDKITHHAVKHINAIKQILLDVIIDITRMQQSFVITDELFHDNPVHREMYEKVQNVAYKRGSTFIPIILRCSTSEIIRRFTSHDRSNEFKQNDSFTARQNCLENTLIKISHSNYIEIDVTNLTAEQSAEEIIRRIEQIL